MLLYTEWQHVFKLDPAKEISDEDLEKLCESGTDAVIVGGTDGVTLDNTLDLLARIRRYSVACALEISELDAVTPGFDYYLVPSVLNAGDPKWITGAHQEALKSIGPLIQWEEMIMEGYCIANPDSKAANRTGVAGSLDDEDILAYAQLADKLFRIPVFYLEYSGVLGPVETVKKTAAVLEQARFFYGGGIRTKEEAAEMAAFADTIVVGNIIYENMKAALSTVKAVKR
ncbi:putative glycerol-1-phosphate prenyltransferase [Sinobaca qinghaiensis]|uniref:Heptaprenylglyceryl phosphate synthase n=1 Tax=Sinobaca qinghaiensis TaxID=342944 RepID=A0A419UZU5_9BACL|nr:heptaprenylglyceryl phosphate synthase [Sinobaca qinghaiensis]RKD71217.1 putative glycerol-1-phosphate prenyltransferase [Sinobaca qinghaiensis]